MGNSSANRISAVETTFAILDALVDLRGAGVTELAEAVDISKSAVYKHLATLEERGFVVQTENNTYQVGIYPLTYGGYARNQLFPFQRIQTAVRELATKTDELVLFSTLTDTVSMPLYHARGEHAVTTDSYPGARLPVHCTASGKAILAAMGERAEPVLSEADLSRQTQNTIIDRAELEEQLTQVRERGYSLEDEERIDGMRGIGAPITDETTGDVLGALALTGPTHRIKDEQFEDTLPELLANRAREIEINITYEHG